jgi:hypothetical protein
MPRRGCGGGVGIAIDDERAALGVADEAGARVACGWSRRHAGSAPTLARQSQLHKREARRTRTRTG